MMQHLEPLTVHFHWVFQSLTVGTSSGELKKKKREKQTEHDVFSLLLCKAVLMQNSSPGIFFSRARRPVGETTDGLEATVHLDTPWP